MFKSISCPTVQLDFDTFHLELQNVLLLGDLLQCFNVVLVASGLQSSIVRSAFSQVSRQFDKYSVTVKLQFSVNFCFILHCPVERP